MFSVNTNLGAMAALQSLNSTETMLQQTQNQVSTGKKISSASDNPAVYSIAQTMQASVSGLAAVSDSLSFGASVVGVAEAATSQIATVLQSLKNSVTQGQQTGIDPATINNNITQMLANLDQFAHSATFNGVNLTATTGTGVGATNSSMSVVSNVAGSVITVSNNDPNNGATVTASDSAGMGLTGLNVSSAAVGLTFTNATAPVANDTLTLATTSGKNYTFMLSDGVTAPAAFGTPQSATQDNSFITFAATDSNGAIMAKISTALQAKGFGAALDNTGQLVISGNGVTNTGTSNAITGGASTAVVAGAAAAIATVDAAIKQLNVNSAYLGSKSNQITGMEQFTSSLSTALLAGIGALTDADMAAESAKLTSLQTKQSLAIQSLSIANQQPQAIMSLFR